MKKILFLTFVLFVSTKVFAFELSTCPRTLCPSGTFMGDDGQCYGCDKEERISIYCIGKETAEKICPNRLIIECAGLYSVGCEKGFEKDNENCCINKEKGIERWQG